MQNTFFIIFDPDSYRDGFSISELMLNFKLFRNRHSCFRIQIIPQSPFLLPHSNYSAIGIPASAVKKSKFRNPTSEITLLPLQTVPEL